MITKAHTSEKKASPKKTNNCGTKTKDHDRCISKLQSFTQKGKNHHLREEVDDKPKRNEVTIHFGAHLVLQSIEHKTNDSITSINDSWNDKY